MLTDVFNWKLPLIYHLGALGLMLAALAVLLGGATVASLDHSGDFDDLFFFGPIVLMASSLMVLAACIVLEYKDAPVDKAFTLRGLKPQTRTRAEHIALKLNPPSWVTHPYLLLIDLLTHACVWFSSWSQSSWRSSQRTWSQSTTSKHGRP